MGGWGGVKRVRKGVRSGKSREISKSKLIQSLAGEDEGLELDVEGKGKSVKG